MTSDSSCGIRAMQTRSVLAVVRGLAPTERDTILDKSGRTMVAELDRTIAMAWFSMESHMRLSDCAREVLEKDRFVDLFEAAMLSSWSSPLLNGFVKMSTTLLGLTPSSLIQRAGYVYPYVTKNLGTLTAQCSPREATVILRGFPANKFNFQCYVDGTLGCLRSLFPLTQSRGAVEVRDLDLRAGDVTYKLSW